MEMKNLQIKEGHDLLLINFIRIGDITYFEGPLLSLFEDSGRLYVFDWVDRDSKFNRWLIYRVSPSALLDFINQKISHLELFNKRPDEIIYYTDIDDSNRPLAEYQLTELSEIPPEYIPNIDNYFEISDCPSVSTLESVILKSLSRRKQENEYKSELADENL
jgi:hypothetical protein